MFTVNVIINLGLFFIVVGAYISKELKRTSDVYDPSDKGVLIVTICGGIFILHSIIQEMIPGFDRDRTIVLSVCIMAIITLLTSISKPKVKIGLNIPTTEELTFAQMRTLIEGMSLRYRGIFVEHSANEATKSPGDTYSYGETLFIWSGHSFFELDNNYVLVDKFFDDFSLPNDISKMYSIATSSDSNKEIDLILDQIDARENRKSVDYFQCKLAYWAIVDLRAAREKELTEHYNGYNLESLVEQAQLLIEFPNDNYRAKILRKVLEEKTTSEIATKLRQKQLNELKELL